MKRRLFIIFVLLIAGAFSEVHGKTAQEIFQEYRPKICLVQFYKNVSSQSEIGSYIKIKQSRIGLLVSADGLVLVNSDVYPLSLDIISGDGASSYSGEPTDFKVKLHTGKEYEADFIGKDELSQVAFLQMKGDFPQPLPYVTFASTEHIQIADPVLLLELLGESYNYQPLFTAYTINSIIPSPRKKFLIKNDVTALSAGGLLIDMEGNAIGVTLRVDIDFSYRPPDEFEEFRKDFLEIAPSEWLMGLVENPPILEKSIYGGKAWFGIGMQALTPALKEYWDVPASGGVVIDRIYPQSPAAKAGLKVGDVMIAFQGKPLKIDRDQDLNRFREMITSQPPETKIRITVFHDGKTQEKQVELASAPRAIDLAEKFQLSDLGIEVREITLDILYDYDYPLDTEGVYVYQVDRASPAGLGGLEIGSIITSINGQPVKNLDAFKAVIEKVVDTNPTKIMFQTRYRRETAFVFVDAK